MTRPILLTGATGLLGSRFATLCADAVVVDRNVLDDPDPDRLASLVARHRPAALINCAGDVDADRAEIDLGPVLRANIDLPRHLAMLCRHHHVLFVHVSSTGCYGDWQSKPFVETDSLRPTTTHHRTKVAGEGVIRAIDPEHLILRTGWLFGGEAHHRKNFVWRRLLEAAAARVLQSDSTQIGNPTFADDLVVQTMHLIASGARGTFNAVGAGTASRYAYVSAIVEAAGLDCRVEPASAFRRAAPVSFNESAVNARLAAFGLDLMPPWTQSLHLYVRRVLEWQAWKAISGGMRAEQDVSAFGDRP